MLPVTGRTMKKGQGAPRELAPGQSPELLKALHILTRDGALNADSLRKLKQVNHLARLLAPAIEDVLARFGEPVTPTSGGGPVVAYEVSPALPAGLALDGTTGVITGTPTAPTRRSQACSAACSSRARSG
jgi:hypothetical protein